MAKRYTVSDINGLRDLYRASPGASTGIGQLVFACYSSGVCMGMCVNGSTLVPWGIRGTFFCGQSSGCATSSCVSNGFTMGNGTFVALGAIGECGGTLWRRIS
jgi:hypothetical protein